MPQSPTAPPPRLASRFKPAPALALLAVTAALFGVFSDHWLGDLSNPVRAAVLFAWLFVIVVWGATSAVRHAERLARYLGEPYGTLVLTLSVQSIEVMTLAMVMLSGMSNPTLARDTIFSVAMIVLNGLLGLSLLLGGWRFQEQEYNLRGVNAYLSLILALAVFALLLPNFTSSAAGPSFTRAQEGFVILMCLGLYGVFLLVQTSRHRGYFVHPRALAEPSQGRPGPVRAAAGEALALLTYLGLVIFLTRKLALVLNHGLEVLHAPTALGALVVAVLVLSPEGLSALRAALRNELQRAVNILLGSVLATLALTTAAVLMIGLVRHTPVTLGLDGAQQPMLVLTLLLTTITFANGVTNILQGAIHLMLFGGFLMLIFWP